MKNFLPMPDKNGYFGEYGGQIIPSELKNIMDDIAAAYQKVSQTKAFQEELRDLQSHYIGRPSPIFHAKNISKKKEKEIDL